MLQVVLWPKLKARGLRFSWRNTRDNISKRTGYLEYFLKLEESISHRRIEESGSYYQTWAMDFHALLRQFPRGKCQISGDLQGVTKSHTLVYGAAREKLKRVGQLPDYYA